MIETLYSTQRNFPPAEAWDAFVALDPRGHLLQTFAWGELKGAFGWIPIRVAVARDRALVAGAQVLYRRLGPCTMGYIPKGPVFLEEESAVVECLWQGLDRLSRRMRAISLKVEPPWQEEEEAERRWLLGEGFAPSAERIQPRRTIVVDLCSSEEEILARMKPKWRYNIRLSMRKGVTVREGGASDLPTFYRLMRITGQRDGFAIHSAAYYERAWALFAPLDRVRLFLAEYEGETLAGLLVYAFNGQAWYMYGASSGAYREFMPNHQLQWRAMQWAKAQGCRIYDLWGITDRGEASESLGGVERFKAGFGGEVISYVGAYDRDYVPPLAWALRRAWAWRRARAGVPPQGA